MNTYFTNLFFDIIVILKLIISKILKKNINDHDNIIKHLYIGSYKTANDINFLIDNNINYVINCTYDLDIPKFYNNLNIKSIRIPLDDTFDDINKIIFNKCIYSITKKIHNITKNKQNILVHCYAGMQRSASIILCYLIYKDYLNGDLKHISYYYNKINNKHKISFYPYPIFKTEIKKYYDRFKN